MSDVVARVPATELRRAAEKLSAGYRLDGPPPEFREEAERLAYLAVRLPATYAAVRSTLSSASESLPGFAPRTMLDLGAGPGTALWAASEALPSLDRLEAVERDAELASLGKKLAQGASSVALRTTNWLGANLESWNAERRYDLVVASYALGELPAPVRRRVLLAALEACDGVLMVVEAGTRRGFEVIAEMRDLLTGAGAVIAAPCPHGKECPMRAAGDWCHFAARVERSSEHRRLKHAELGHEDEKFSYVVAAKIAAQPAAARIVRHPMRYSGYTRLKLCTIDGLEEETVTRSQKERYREAKRSEWGSRWSPR
ncbi:MAG: small ribosomal subunit Rsm22 family protein [Acidobacteriaceae bacterium]